MADPSEEKRKIIVDEDWKSQVERERAQARQGQSAPPSESDADTAADAAIGDLPPASLELLITTLVTQALACLGQLPDPLEKKPVLHFDLAQHHIDMLGVLQDKTRGNLTPDEDALLESVLHQLRMLYVSVKQQAGS